MSIPQLLSLLADSPTPPTYERPLHQNPEIDVLMKSGMTLEQACTAHLRPKPAEIPTPELLAKSIAEGDITGAIAATDPVNIPKIVKRLMKDQGLDLEAATVEALSIARAGTAVVTRQVPDEMAIHQLALQIRRNGTSEIDRGEKFYRPDSMPEVIRKLKAENPGMDHEQVISRAYVLCSGKGGSQDPRYAADPADVVPSNWSDGDPLPDLSAALQSQWEKANPAEKKRLAALIRGFFISVSTGSALPSDLFDK